MAEAFTQDQAPDEFSLSIDDGSWSDFSMAVGQVFLVRERACTELLPTAPCWMVGKERAGSTKGIAPGPMALAPGLLQAAARPFGSSVSVV